MEEKEQRMTVQEIAATYWTSKSARRAIRSIVALTQEHLNSLAPGVTLTTSALIRALGGTTEHIKSVASHLTTARADGLLDRYFDRGKKGAFGKESVIWHKQREMTNDERVAIFKRDLGEDYRKPLTPEEDAAADSARARAEREAAAIELAQENWEV